MIKFMFGAILGFILGTSIQFVRNFDKNYEFEIETYFWIYGSQKIGLLTGSNIQNIV